MTEGELLEAIRRAVAGGVVVTPDTVEVAPDAPGAYALAVYLAAPLSFSRPRLGGAILSGWHVYAGSARGAGGLRARLRRHLRRDKSARWHIDDLTNVAARSFALAVIDGSECDLVARLLRSGGFEPGLSGFGSSDCRHCPTHLLKPKS